MAESVVVAVASVQGRVGVSVVVLVVVPLGSIDHCGTHAGCGDHCDGQNGWTVFDGKSSRSCQRRSYDGTNRYRFACGGAIAGMYQAVVSVGAPRRGSQRVTLLAATAIVMRTPMQSKKLISTISCRVRGENESTDRSNWGRKCGVARVVECGGSVVC
uniref:Secreted protein n=1 Tax=Romanomermis culicivorax TaxID=13658 RepID=A0A915IZX0_ROMCU